jgi:hypothetical protein
LLTLVLALAGNELAVADKSSVDGPDVFATAALNFFMRLEFSIDLLLMRCEDLEPTTGLVDVELFLSGVEAAVAPVDEDEELDEGAADVAAAATSCFGTCTSDVDEDLSAVTAVVVFFAVDEYEAYDDEAVED